MSFQVGSVVEQASADGTIWLVDVCGSVVRQVVIEQSGSGELETTGGAFHHTFLKVGSFVAAFALPPHNADVTDQTQIVLHVHMQIINM